MLGIKKARKFIQANPDDPSSAILSELVVALESETPMAITSLYKLGYDEFKLALEILDEWRLDRYYTSKVRLLDLSVQLSQMKRQTDNPEVQPSA
ncbi:MAG: hypothetical protein ACLGG8_06205 [Gammaproteobacteria bacterium]